MDRDRQRRARESIDTLHEISQILNTGLDKKSLSLCVSLCEQGISPEVVVVRLLCFCLFAYSLILL